MPSGRFKHAIPAIEWPQAYASDRTATGIGFFYTGLHNETHAAESTAVIVWHR
jgi:hypothetical protein